MVALRDPVIVVCRGGSYLRVSAARGTGIRADRAHSSAPNKSEISRRHIYKLEAEIV